jgi:signal transduction histidine kinase
LNAIRRFISTVPAWAFGLVLLAVTVNTIYFIYKHQISVDGQSNHRVNGKCVINYVTPGGASDNAGMLPGDTLLAVDGIDVHEWSNINHDVRAGDTCIYGVVRNGQSLDLPVVFTSPFLFFYGFTITIYVILILLSIASLHLVFKKPDDTTVRLFFVYLQLFAISQNATFLFFRDALALGSSIIFWLSGCLMGPVLIHFHLLFPRTAKIYTRFRKLPLVLYSTGIMIFIYCLIYYIPMVYGRYGIFEFFSVRRIVLSWLSLTYLFALAIVFYQFVTIKATLSRNQLRLVIIGSFFGIYTAVMLAIAPGIMQHISAGYPYFVPVAQGTGGLVMIAFILIAVFRYRIWDINIILRKALLYLGASIMIILSYFLIIFVVNKIAEKESDLIRFLALAVSVILFLVLRDRLQRLIDRLFHRESYDSAIVVADFEEKLSGGYRIEDLGYRILDGLDDIFHFHSFVLCLKEGNFSYNPAFIIGPQQENLTGKFIISHEFEKRLIRSKVFSVAELNEKTDYLVLSEGELIVPMVKSNEPFGFFLCGPKKSEKTYSMQDIRVLSLIAKRVIALFQTAALYQKDLDRQLMLERERARISQDMHDDVGASLTRISILSELAKNKDDLTGETKKWLGQISDTSRGVMEEMSQIIWALNPKNDTLEGLIAYLRRFANEFLEPTTIKCSFDLPEILPVRALSVEMRRNVYLVVREALHNVVKHSGASRVDIRLSIFVRQLADRFSISIKDNGKGFDPGKLEFPGNGLVNMRKRIMDIGGEIIIRSGIDTGTEIEIEVLMG